LSIASRAHWLAQLRLGRFADALVSGAALVAVQSLADLTKRPLVSRTERQTACTSAGSIEDLVRVATIALPKGGSVDPTTAGKILSALPGLSEFLSSVKKTSCR
jgi:hypothetical protein